MKTLLGVKCRVNKTKATKIMIPQFISIESLNGLLPIGSAANLARSVIDKMIVDTV